MNTRLISEQSAPAPRVLPYILAGMIALAVLVLGFGVWATQSRLSGAIIAPGVVQADVDRHVVQHPTGGVLREVLVREGDSVVAGQLLARLDSGPAQAALEAARAHSFDLMAQRDRLRALQMGRDALDFTPALLAESRRDPAFADLLDGQRALFEATRATLNEQLNQLRRQTAKVTAQIAGLDGQKAALAVQVALVDTALKNQQAVLSRGLVPAATVLDFEREKSRLQGELALLAGQRAQAEERLGGLQVERLQRRALHREKAMTQSGGLEQPLREYRTEMRALEAQIAQAEIRASTAGIVYDMQIDTAQAVLRPAEPLLFIVPQDKPRVFVAHVSPKDVDQVTLGQMVKLRLSALNQRLTPEIAGKVTGISADAMVERSTGARYFQVRVLPLQSDLAKLPEGTVLLPGMPVEVFLETGAWSPFEYLAKPVADYLARAFRES